MKQLILSILVFTLSSLLFACASNSKSELDEKYSFPELKQVNRIFSNRIDGWGAIDKQSLFVSTSPSTSYLIILRRPNNDIRFAHNLAFETRGSSLEAKFDSLKFFNPTDSIEPIPAFIEKIYEVKGREQKKQIRAKILGTSKNTQTQDL